MKCQHQMLHNGIHWSDFISNGVIGRNPPGSPSHRSF